MARGLGVRDGTLGVWLRLPTLELHSEAQTPPGRQESFSENVFEGRERQRTLLP